MCAAAMLAPCLLKRSRLVRTIIARLRSQTPIAAVRRDDIATVPLAKPAARQIAAVLPAAPRHPPAVSAMIDALRSASTTLGPATG